MIATARVDSVVTFPSARIPNLDVLRAHSLRWVKNFRHPSRVFHRVKGCFSHARLPAGLEKYKYRVPKSSSFETDGAFDGVGDFFILCSSIPTERNPPSHNVISFDLLNYTIKEVR